MAPVRFSCPFRSFSLPPILLPRYLRAVFPFTLCSDCISVLDVNEILFIHHHAQPDSFVLLFFLFLFSRTFPFSFRVTLSICQGTTKWRISFVSVKVCFNGASGLFQLAIVPNFEELSFYSIIFLKEILSISRYNFFYLIDLKNIAKFHKISDRIILKSFAGYAVLKFEVKFHNKGIKVSEQF